MCPPAFLSTWLPTMSPASLLPPPLQTDKLLTSWSPCGMVQKVSQPMPCYIPRHSLRQRPGREKETYRGRSWSPYTGWTLFLSQWGLQWGFSQCSRNCSSARCSRASRWCMCSCQNKPHWRRLHPQWQPRGQHAWRGSGPLDRAGWEDRQEGEIDSHIHASQ